MTAGDLIDVVNDNKIVMLFSTLNEPGTLTYVNMDMITLAKENDTSVLEEGEIVYEFENSRGELFTAINSDDYPMSGGK